MEHGEGELTLMLGSLMVQLLMRVEVLVLVLVVRVVEVPVLLMFWHLGKVLFLCYHNVMWAMLF